MDLKTYLKESSKRIEKLNQEGKLVDWLISYARSLPEKSREDFLHELDGPEVSVIDPSVLQDVLSFVRDVKGKGVCLCMVYDDYEESGYAYYDPDKILSRVDQYYKFGEDCLHAGEYDIAVKVFDALNNLTFYARDEDDVLYREHFTWEDLEYREIYTLDKPHVCALTLCAYFLAYEKDERAEAIAEVLQQDIFSGFSLEQMFMVKHIVLPDTDVFLKELVIALIDRKGNNAAKFFAQAIKLCYSEEEQLQFGLQYVSIHPHFLSDQLDLLLCNHQYTLVLAYGMQAIDIMPKNMEARGVIARMTAVAAYNLGKYEEEIKALKAQFVSSCSPYAIYALMTRVKMDDEEIEALLQKAKQNSRFDSKYDEADETRSFFYNKENDMYISFFRGSYETVIDHMEKNPGRYRFENYLTLLILAISDTEAHSKAVAEMMQNTEQMFKETFFKDYLTAEERMKTWLAFGYLDEIQKRYIFDEIRCAADRYASSIISNKERRHYYDAAMYLTGVAEAGVYLGIRQNRDELISFYLEYYKRYTAFTAAIRSYF